MAMCLTSSWERAVRFRPERSKQRKNKELKKLEQPNGSYLLALEKGETANPNGRPKGAESLKTIFNKILSGQTTIKEGGIKRKVTKYEALALRILQDALTHADPNVRLKAFNTIADRFEGKPKQEIEQSGKVTVGFDFEELTPEQAEKILETIRGK